MRHFGRKEFLKKALAGGFLTSLGLSNIKSFLGDSDKVNDETTLALPIDIDKDWDELRKLFPLTYSRNYFNTGGIGASPKKVVDAVYHNMILSETRGDEKRKSLKNVRSKVAKFLNANPKNIAFTRNTTEGMNIIARELSFKEGDEIVLSTHEHIGGASPWVMLQKEIGVKLKLVDLDLSGEQNLELIKNSISPKTKLVCISHVTCTTGMKLPVNEIVKLCKEKGVYSCIDGAQAIGMMPVDLGTMNPDFYVCSGHKWLLGPKGTGIIYIGDKAFSEMKPLFSGAYSDSDFNLSKRLLDFVGNPSRLEYGTRNIPLIMGLEAAIDFVDELNLETLSKRNKELARYLVEKLSENPKIEIISPLNDEFSTSMISFRVKGKDYLRVRNTLTKTYLQRVRAIYENDLNAVRVCIAIYNNKEQVDQLVKDINVISQG